MSNVIVFDTTPLGMAAQLPKSATLIAFYTWIAQCVRNGREILVPELADFEVRRELIRSGNIAGIGRLDAFIAARPDRYVAITTPAMRLAADLWAQARNANVPTADKHALDGDVIVAAQALTLGFTPSNLIVVTSNVAHLARYVSADEWTNIVP